MRFLLIAVSVLAFAGSAAAQTTDTIAEVVFKEAEKRLIEEFFANKAAKSDDDEDQGKKKKKDKKSKKGKSKDLPPGLAKKDELPPGLAKQLQRKGTLPPGLAKRDLPADLAARLPPPPTGQERVIVDNDVVLIERATGVILDILADVVK